VLTERGPDLSLFVDILRTLEAIEAPYVIIGAFAGTVFGITRATYDVDMVVSLSEEHIQALAAHYPPPRYYAYPEQIRDSIRRGIIWAYCGHKGGDMGQEVMGFWEAVKEAAHQELERQRSSIRVRRLHRHLLGRRVRHR
jgi:hypothetical protein